MALPQRFLIFILYLAFASCKMDETHDVNQRKIFTEYELFYNKSEDRTYAKAQFRHKKSNGNVLRLTSPSFIHFSDAPLEYNTLTQSYEKIFDGFIEKGEFLWEDLDGNRYRNFITLTPIEIKDIQELNTQLGETITWSGAPLRNNETVMLFLIPDSPGAPRYVMEETDKDHFTIPTSFSSSYSGQTARVIIQRTHSSEPGQKTEAGGKLSGRYRDEEKKILFR